MHNQERAEKILALCNMPITDSAYNDPHNGLPRFLKKDIIRELDEAVREHHHCKDVKTICCEYAFKEGFASAREQAAGIAAQSVMKYNGLQIAERIRAMEVEK